MYWNNLWVNNFNRKIFLNKTLFIENIFYFIFSEKIFRFFFTKLLKKFIKTNPIFKSFFVKKNNLRKRKFTFFKKRAKKKGKKKISYNFTRIWFIKFNNYILFTTFVFFYFRVKKRKKLKKIKLKLSRRSFIFFKKRRGRNIKRKLFLNNNYLIF